MLSPSGAARGVGQFDRALCASQFSPVPDLDFQFSRGAVLFPRLGLWLDARESRSGGERVFVSHAHSDHIGRHREVILTPATARLMAARLGGKRQAHELALGETRAFRGPGAGYRLALRGAGHIYGSAMAHVEAEGGSLLYTGDFKLKNGLAAEICEPCRADILVMETTFGLPRYIFPPVEEIWAGIIQFCTGAMAGGGTAVLLAYSLGKSQELLLGLGRAGLPVMLQDQARKLTRVCAELGQIFPEHTELDVAQAAGKVVICPPGSPVLAELREQGRARVAMVTGWAMDSSTKYRYGVDAAFPLSDHADFGELLELVERVQPRLVCTLHGFAAEFAQTLRERGHDARALGMQEQLQLALFH
ncbi:MAG TPA: MBL fold metallo-hydrolase [Verrucomicrobiae bacterium]|nr:MBL fold metallo-hydrolase [Verrucomicrobiae bacterium]